MLTVAKGSVVVEPWLLRRALAPVNQIISEHFDIING